MDRAARRFARWVLIFHLALLGLVLLIVAVSARTLYASAREQAIDQAKQTQELLAQQTALGLQNYYDSITGVLEPLQPPEIEPQTPSSRPTEPEPVAPRREPPVGPIRRALDENLFTRVAPSIWKILSDKISVLFIIDPEQPGEIVRVIGAADGAPEPKAVVHRAGGWLGTVERASVSPFIELAPNSGAHLVCMPLRGHRGLLIVAVVPVAKIEQNLLQRVNSRATTGAMLVDDEGIIVSNPRTEVVGKNVLRDSRDPRLREIAQRYINLGSAGTEVFEDHEVIGGVRMDPAMTTIQPADILGRRWFVVINSSLDDIEKVVKPIFRDALLWSGFLMLATLAILMSTAIQLIRGRVRLERVRHEMIRKELNQAREIQLAWLPHNDDDPPWIDLAAVNEPATQISGDFYNWFQLCDGRTVVVIGDVTGHGMAAAFLMATTQLLVRTTMPRYSEPGACLTEVNRQLCQQAFNGQFVTMLLLVIDVHSGEVAAAAAGHPPPLVGQAERFEPLAIEPQLVLGVDPESNYTTQQFHLPQRSALVLYTDGVVDAVRADGKRFQVEGLARSLYGRYADAQAILDVVIDAVDEFRGEVELPDDLTLVAIHMQESPARADRRAPARVVAT
jgi:serine phosphatase RsbU (regulator of sigma subunit)